MNGMALKRTRAVTTWLLAVFLLRSLIPVGFMPMIGPGHSVQLALCEGYGPVPMDMGMNPHMDMSQPGHLGTHQDHGTCLFGASPALGGPPAVCTPPAVQLQATDTAARSAQIIHHEVSYRAQSARGPPV